MPMDSALRRVGGRAMTIRFGSLLLAGAIASVGCSDEKSATELNPEGPPMVRQVFVQELTNATPRRERFQLAFGDHPDIPLPDNDPTWGDDRQVVNAIAFGTSRIRIVLDELVRGNDIEEIACADGTYSTVPPGTTPDDIKDCAGPVEALGGCTAVCIGPSGPVGILDENEDGASDARRMREYGPGELAVALECGGNNIPLDRDRSYYQPAGNQLLPAIDLTSPNAPDNINALGPALMLIPQSGLRTGASCTVSFRPEVQDKDGNQVCAPPNGDVAEGCSGGDTSAIAFTVEPLALRGSDPGDGDTGVPLTAAGSPDAAIYLEFVAGIDVATLDAITLADADGNDVPVTAEALEDDPRLVIVTVPGGYTADTSYTLTIGTALTDQLGGALPQAITIQFTTGTGPAPMVDAGPDAA